MTLNLTKLSSTSVHFSYNQLFTTRDHSIAKHPIGKIHLNRKTDLFGDDSKYIAHNGIQIMAAVGLMIHEKAAKLRAMMISLLLLLFLAWVDGQ